jgi:hypothetical protein
MHGLSTRNALITQGKMNVDQGATVTPPGIIAEADQDCATFTREGPWRPGDTRGGEGGLRAAAVGR